MSGRLHEKCGFYSINITGSQRQWEPSRFKLFLCFLQQVWRQLRQPNIIFVYFCHFGDVNEKKSCWVLREFWTMSNFYHGVDTVPLHSWPRTNLSNQGKPSGCLFTSHGKCENFFCVYLNNMCTWFTHPPNVGSVVVGNPIPWERSALHHL